MLAKQTFQRLKQILNEDTELLKELKNINPDEFDDWAYDEDGNGALTYHDIIDDYLCYTYHETNEDNTGDVLDISFQSLMEANKIYTPKYLYNQETEVITIELTPNK